MYECNKCGHEWTPRLDTKPGMCPKCKTKKISEKSLPIDLPISNQNLLNNSVIRKDLPIDLPISKSISKDPETIDIFLMKGADKEKVNKIRGKLGMSSI